MNEIIDFKDWRENFLHSFKNVTTDEDFTRLSRYYPDNKSNKDKCKQRKNNLLRSGNRNIYLDDLYAVSCYTNKSPDCLLLGQNNIVSFWNELKGENLFSNETIEKITESLKSDKNYRNLYIPKEMEDFLYYAKTIIFNLNKNKIRTSVFNLTENSLDFLTTVKPMYSYSVNLFNGNRASDVFCDYLQDSEVTDFKDLNEEDFEMFKSTLNVYLDCSVCESSANDKDVKKRVKNWVCNCTMWLVLSYIGDTCQRLSVEVEEYLKQNKTITEFMFNLFVFGTKTTLQKRVTDEKTNEKRRVRYSAFLDCYNEKLVAETEYLDYYDEEDIIPVSTASFSDMQKSSLGELLNYEYR